MMGEGLGFLDRLDVGQPHAQALAHELERTLATLDTSTHEAVEVIQLVAIEVGAAAVGGETMIRLVEQGEPSAAELREQGLFPQPVHRIVRYDAETIDTLRTYVDVGEKEDVERLVNERFEIGGRDPGVVADRLIESLERHGDEWGDA